MRRRLGQAAQLLQSLVNSVAWPIFERVGAVAKPAPRIINLCRTLAQTLTMWAIFLAAGPALCFALEGWLGLARWRFNYPGQHLAATGIFVAGWMLAWCSSFCMVTWGDGTPLPAVAPRRLVIRGPYRYVRNPMAMGSLAQGAAIALYLGSPLTLLYILVGTLMWNFGARPWEEHDLLRRFGQDYSHYQSAVRCWVPRHRPYP